MQISKTAVLCQEPILYYLIKDFPEIHMIMPSLYTHPFSDIPCYPELHVNQIDIQLSTKMFPTFVCNFQVVKVFSSALSHFIHISMWWSLLSYFIDEEKEV